MYRLLTGLVIGFLVLAFTHAGFAQSSGGITVQWGDGAKQGPSSGGYKKKGGPPPHAPAHGYRAKHQYRYYPSRNVYYDQGRGVYFYIKGDGWAVGASLPTHLQSDLGYAVNIDLDSDTPYEFNAEHLKQYPKEKYQRGKAAKK
jgi:hypothetical protein